MLLCVRQNAVHGVSASRAGVCTIRYSHCLVRALQNTVVNKEPGEWTNEEVFQFLAFVNNLRSLANNDAATELLEVKTIAFK